MNEATYLLDTNILLRVTRFGPLHDVTVGSAVDLLLSRGARLCFTLQNLTELWNVCTRPRDRNGFGLNTDEANAVVERTDFAFEFLPDIVDVYLHWRRLVMQYRVSGAQVHDARLVASMLAHNLTHILRLNQQDFSRYTGIEAVHPATVVTT